MASIRKSRTQRKDEQNDISSQLFSVLNEGVDSLSAQKQARLIVEQETPENRLKQAYLFEPLTKKKLAVGKKQVENLLARAAGTSTQPPLFSESTSKDMAQSKI